MNQIVRLVLCEICYRKLSFALAVVAVAVAVAILMGQVLLLDQHDRRTEAILQEKQAETQARMAKLEDEIRVITKNLGFNIRILPKDLDLFKMHVQGYGDKTMPEEYATRLAGAKLITINHLLPTLQQRTNWPERRIPAFILVGTRGEVPIAFQDKKKPILEPVPAGKIVLGHHLQDGLKAGDPVSLHGKKFIVHKLHGQRGDDDDITAWMPLANAQEILGKKGQINGMLALGCNCSAERLGIIREEIAAILPDTQVEEFETKATARAEARNKVAAESQAALQREADHRREMRAEKEAFAAVVVPLMILGCGIWLGLLAWMNVLERETEIGLYRALGWRSGQLFALFLSRAGLVGWIGGLAGIIGGAGIAMLWGEEPFTLEVLIILMAGVFVAAPVLSCLACWLPALAAVRRDPAMVLQRE